MKRFILTLLLSLSSISLWAQTTISERVMQHLRAGDMEKASAELKSSEASNKKNADWYYAKGRFEYANRQHQEALSSFEKATDYDKKNVEYQVWVANAAGTAAQNASVIKQPFLARKCKSAYEKALELDPTHEEALIGLMNYHLQAPAIVGGDVKEAQKLLVKLKAQNPYRALYQEVSLALRDKQQDKAIGLLETAKAHFPDSAKVYYQLGMIHFEQQDYAKAYTELDSSWQRNKSDWGIQYQIGRLAALSGTYLNEGAWFLENLTLNIPTDMSESFKSMLFTRLAQVQKHQQKNELAKVNLNKALEINPKNEVAQKELKLL